MINKLFTAISVLLLCASCSQLKFIAEQNVCEECTGKGNINENLVDAVIYLKSACADTVQAKKQSYWLKGVKYSLCNVSDLNEIENLILVANDAHGNEHVLAQLPVDKEENSFSLKTPLQFSDTLVLHIRGTVSANAKEGNMVTARFVSAQINGTAVEFNPADSLEIGGRRVLLARKLLFAPGDYGSQNWRIPAIATLQDGSLLAVADKRKFNEADIPEDIDIVARKSYDKGKTWTTPVDIVVGTGRGKGYGDAALMLADNGDVVCAFIGGNGLWASTPDNPQNSYISVSKDGGYSWSKAEDITQRIWGKKAVNKDCRNYTASFFASGNGITLKRGKYAGRIMVVAAMRPANHLNNYVVYSDDNGKSWQVSDLAFEGGDEAKVVELTNGDVLMSVRRSGERGYNISQDGGVTWGKQGTWPQINTNACNGDIVRLSSTDNGDEKDILIHSIPNNIHRKRVSIFASYDEGKSWQDPKLICPGGSAYSSLTVLKDGTIGLLVEENADGGAMSIWYMNFSKEWLLGGK